MKRTLRGIILAAAIAMIAMPAAAQKVVKMTVTAGHPPVFLWVQLLDGFMLPEIDARLKAAGDEVRIEWTKAYGGTVAKIGGEMQAIRDGLSDMGFVGTIFQGPQMPLQNISYFTPFGATDIATVTAVVSDLQGSIAGMNDAWEKNNQVFLGGAALDNYHLFTTFPVKSIDDLKGKKIMAPGPSANWIKGTGAVAVAAALPQYYNNIKTGVADGVVTFVTGAFPIKLHEVAPHMTKVSFGSQFAGGVSINKQRFDSFSPEVQQIFRDVGAEFAKKFAEAQATKAKTLLEKLIAGGLKVAEMEDAERTRWATTIPNAAKTWASTLDGKGMPGTEVLNGFMAGIQKAGATVPRDWSKE